MIRGEIWGLKKKGRKKKTAHTSFQTKRDKGKEGHGYYTLAFHRKGDIVTAKRERFEGGIKARGGEKKKKRIHYYEKYEGGGG